MILSAFLQGQYATLSEAEQVLFERLLETPDPQLTAWLYHDVAPTDQGMATIVRRILSASRR